jgi:hypothetical protein
MVDEVAQTSVVFPALKKGDAPTIGMVVGDARTLCKPGETKRCIGGVFAIETEKLTHTKVA